VGKIKSRFSVVRIFNLIAVKKSVKNLKIAININVKRFVILEIVVIAK